MHTGAIDQRALRMICAYNAQAHEALIVSLPQHARSALLCRTPSDDLFPIFLYAVTDKEANIMSMLPQVRFRVARDSESRSANAVDRARCVSLLSPPQHPNVVRYFGTVLEKPHVALVLEFCCVPALWEGAHERPRRLCGHSDNERHMRHSEPTHNGSDSVGQLSAVKGKVGESCRLAGPHSLQSGMIARSAGGLPIYSLRQLLSESKVGLTWADRSGLLHGVSEARIHSYSSSIKECHSFIVLRSLPISGAGSAACSITPF